MNEDQLNRLAEKIADKMSTRPCPLGFTEEDAGKLKSLSKFLDTAFQTTVKVLITIGVTAVIGWAAAGFVVKVFANHGN